MAKGFQWRLVCGNQRIAGLEEKKIVRVAASERSQQKERARVRQGCNLAHVLGLYRMTGAPGAAFALGARGALADVALWAIARLQTRLFASRTFAKRAPARAAQLQEYGISFLSSPYP
jgi:hypothetical protein